MATASGARAALQYIAEVTRGTTPGTPQMKILRATQININPRKNLLESNERRPDRQKRDVRHGFQSIEGTIGTELSLWNADDWIAACLGGAWTANVLKVGTTVATFTAERRFEDLALYQVFKGVNPNTLALSIQPEQIVTANFGVIGMSTPAMSGTQLDATPTAAQTHAPFASFDGSIEEGGSAIAVVTGLEINIDNNRALQPVVGSNTSPDVYDGRCNVSGRISAMFESATLLNKFLNETESSIYVRLDDPDGVNWLDITIPRIKYSGGDIDPPDSGPVIQDLPFVALYDESDATTIMFERSNAPA